MAGAGDQRSLIAVACVTEQLRAGSAPGRAAAVQSCCQQARQARPRGPAEGAQGDRPRLGEQVQASVSSLSSSIAILIVMLEVTSVIFCLFLLHPQIHIDIPRMNPEALILQPEVTEVRAVPGGACPGGGCRCPGKPVGAAGELHLQQVWASPPTGVRPSLCFRQPDCRAEACRAHTPSPLASLAQGPCPNLVAPSSDLRLCFSRSLLTPRRACDVCVGVTESDGLELCCPCGAWFLQVVFLSLPRLLQFGHLPVEQPPFQCRALPAASLPLLGVGVESGVYLGDRAARSIGGCLCGHSRLTRGSPGL